MSGADANETENLEKLKRELEEYRTQNDILKEENSRLSEELELKKKKHSELNAKVEEEKESYLSIQKQSVEQIQKLGEENQILKETLNQAKLELIQLRQEKEKWADRSGTELERVREEKERLELEINKLRLQLSKPIAEEKKNESQLADYVELQAAYSRDHSQLEFITDYVNHLESQIDEELLRINSNLTSLKDIPTHEKLEMLVSSLQRPADARLTDVLSCADRYLHRLVGDACDYVSDPVERMKSQLEVTCRRSQKLNYEYIQLKKKYSEILTERTSVESIRPLIQRLAVHMHVVSDTPVEWSDLAKALQRLDDIVVKHMPVVGMRYQRMHEQMEHDHLELRRCQEELRRIKNGYCTV